MRQLQLSISYALTASFKKLLSSWNNVFFFSQRERESLSKIIALIAYTSAANTPNTLYSKMYFTPIHVERPQRQERSRTRGALHNTPKPQAEHRETSVEKQRTALSTAPSGLWKLEESIQIWFHWLHLGSKRMRYQSGILQSLSESAAITCASERFRKYDD